MENRDSVVDLAFPVRGTLVPADHGYLLYSAIARQLPALHGDPTVGVHPIRGQFAGQRRIALTQDSELILRLPATLLPEAIRLAGRQLAVGEERLRVGVPAVRSLSPASVLFSRLVTIKGFQEADAFLEAVRRQLGDIGIAATPSLVDRRYPRPVEAGVGSRDRVLRRTVRIKEREIVGFALTVSDLGANDSLTLQAVGVGGRRRFGCGIFIPVPRAEQ